MSTTVTIRTDESLRRRLEARAAATGKTISEVVREILEDVLAERPAGDRTAHLKGRLARGAAAAEPWRKRLRERNWRP